MGGVDGVRCRRTGLGALRPRLWWLWDTPPVAPVPFPSHPIGLGGGRRDRLTWCVYPYARAC
jgi:hypothetical protein